jgi:hypothetical protein
MLNQPTTTKPTPMKITTIEATASRTFNHPTERFANFRFAIRLGAETSGNPARLEDEVNDLRAMAETIAETHKRQILEEVSLETSRERLRLEIEVLQSTPDRIASFQKRIAQEMEKPEDERWDLEGLQGGLERCEGWEAKLAEAEAKLAALPAPSLMLLKEVHPGHPDHPATEEDDSGY